MLNCLYFDTLPQGPKNTFCYSWKGIPSHHLLERTKDEDQLEYGPELSVFLGSEIPSKFNKVLEDWGIGHIRSLIMRDFIFKILADNAKEKVWWPNKIGWIIGALYS